MKLPKILLITLLSCAFTVYLLFLFVLPNAIDLNKFSGVVADGIQKETGFRVKVIDIKPKTYWNLSFGAIVKRADLIYPNGEKFAQVNNFDVRLSLLHLIFGNVKVDKINCEKLILSLKVKPNGELLIEDFIKSSKKVEKLPIYIKFSDVMPEVNIDKYRLTFVDIETNRKYSIKGTDLDISDFVLGKKIKFSTQGNIVFNDKNNVSYNLAVLSKYFPKLDEKTKMINFIDIFDAISKYDLKAKIESNLKIIGTDSDIKAYGKIYLDEVSLSVEGEKLPESFLHLVFNAANTKIDSKLFTGIDSFAKISGDFRNAKEKAIDLKVLANRVDLKKGFLLSEAVIQLIGKNSLKNLSASGYCDADFSINSDLKKIKSVGYLKIKDASIKNKLHNIILNSINANIDFSQNKINIKKASANLNNQPIIIKGSVDTGASANIIISAEDLPLKGFLATFDKGKMLDENIIKNGFLSLKVSLNGALSQAVPSIDLIISNAEIYNKKLKTNIKMQEAKINMISNKKKIDGKLLLSNLSLKNSSKMNLTAPSLEMIFDEKDIKILSSNILLNDSKLLLAGHIKDYKKNQELDIQVKGAIDAPKIKNIFPSKVSSNFNACGKIPMISRIVGKKDRFAVRAQMLADSKNYLEILPIITIKNKNTLIDAKMFFDGVNLKTDSTRLYLLKKNVELSNNFSDNIIGAVSLATLNGELRNLNLPSASFNNFLVEIPGQITLSIPSIKSSTASLNGSLLLNGRLNQPNITGSIFLNSASVPDYKLLLKNASVHFDKNGAMINCPQISILTSIIRFKALASSDFSKGLLIKDIDFVSDNLNLSELMPILSSSLPNSYLVDFPVKILAGKSFIKQFSVAKLVSSDVNSHISLSNNILKASNIRAKAYLGDIEGVIDYNLKTQRLEMDMKGRGLTANPAITAITGRNDDINGTLAFDAKLSMIAGKKEKLAKSIKGKNVFVITNGKMGVLGKLEHFLYAQNVISNNIFKATLNVVAKAATVKNTGVYKYMKGQLLFNDGCVDINPIATSGPSMSMYISGKYYILQNMANLIVLGRISDDVVKVLGPIGELSMNKVISSIPKVGQVTAQFINQFTINPNYENTSQIPELSPKTHFPTREFKVVISGELQKQSSVKSFKWISAPKSGQVTSVAEKERVQQVLQAPLIPDFINKLPDMSK